MEYVSQLLQEVARRFWEEVRENLVWSKLGFDSDFDSDSESGSDFVYSSYFVAARAEE